MSDSECCSIYSLSSQCTYTSTQKRLQYCTAAPTLTYLQRHAENIFTLGYLLKGRAVVLNYPCNILQHKYVLWKIIEIFSGKCEILRA